MTSVEWTGKRVETGPIKFGDDWAGFFFRGDDAFTWATFLYKADGERLKRVANRLADELMKCCEVTLERSH